MIIGCSARCTSVAFRGAPEERLAALRRANDARCLPPSALLPNLGIVDRKRVIHRGYLLPRDICDDF